VRTGLARAPTIERVVFCCFSAQDQSVYERVLADSVGVGR